jgi:low affinity Fe/Cu permease
MPTPHSHERYRSQDFFRQIAAKAAHGVGHPVSFALAMLTVIAWAASGRIFGYSDTWQLVINTGTTIVTFLMVFLVQNTQNRDSHALHLKLDELIAANRHARKRMIALEELSEDELAALQKDFDRLAREKVRGRSPRARERSPQRSDRRLAEHLVEADRAEIVAQDEPLAGRRELTRCHVVRALDDGTKTEPLALEDEMLALAEDASAASARDERHELRERLPQRHHRAAGGPERQRGATNDDIDREAVTFDFESDEVSED